MRGVGSVPRTQIMATSKSEQKEAERAPIIPLRNLAPQGIDYRLLSRLPTALRIGSRFESSLSRGLGGKIERGFAGGLCLMGSGAITALSICSRSFLFDPPITAYQSITTRQPLLICNLKTEYGQRGLSELADRWL